MQSSLKPIYLVLGLAGACSLVNKFDPVADVPAAGGSGGAGGSSAGTLGEAGIGGSDTMGGSSAGGKGGKGGGPAAEAGAAGESGGVTGDPLTGGVIVVGTNVGTGTAAKHYVVLIDPLDGHEITRTATTFAVLAIAYESARDKWFVFTGTPGQSGDPTGPLLVGSMRSTGFQVEQTATVPKPTNTNTVAVLNQRILYRSAQHDGQHPMVDDVLTLLDTSGTVQAKGKLTIPVKNALVSIAGKPATGQAAGGRVFFLHDNNDVASNCIVTDAGAGEACSVYESSLSIAAADGATLAVPAVTPIAQIDLSGSVPALGIQPGGNTAVIVVPPQRGIDTEATVFKYNASTGGAIGTVKFSLETATKKVDPNNSITIPAVAVDPCVDLLFAGELANTALLYGVPIGTAAGTVVAFDPNTQNGTVGNLVYEPFSKTLISYTFDVTTPTFSGFQLSGMPTAPVFTARGKTGAAAWKIPVGLVPVVVAVQNPESPPCQ